jgi:hypothetical protein
MMCGMEEGKKRRKEGRWKEGTGEKEKIFF